MTTASTPARSGRMAGFTLIELMVTVAVLAILVAIATTAYTSETQKSRRTDARNAILDLAGREERFYSVANAYSQLTTDLGYQGAWPQNVGSGFYSINVVALPNANPPSYTITATAIGAQVNDTACATMWVDQTGQQYSTNSGGVQSTGAASVCWSN